MYRDHTDHFCRLVGGSNCREDPPRGQAALPLGESAFSSVIGHDLLLTSNARYAHQFGSQQDLQSVIIVSHVFGMSLTS